MHFSEDFCFGDFFVRESASPDKVSAGDGEAVFRTHAPSRFALGAGLDKRTGHRHRKKKKQDFCPAFLCW